MTPLPTCLRFCALLLPTLIFGCTPTVLPAASAPPQIALTVYDAQGTECKRDAVPQWPAFELHEVPYDPELPLFVILGELDADLIDDLAALPLRQANLARTVPFLGAATATGTLIWPSKPLQKGALYTIALLPGQATRSILPAKEPFAIEVLVSDDPTAGAALLSSLPVHQQTGVDPAIPSLRVAFDGHIDDCAVLSVHGEHDTKPFPAVAKALQCKSFDDHAASCCMLELEKKLAPSTRYTIALDSLTDSHGAPILGDSIEFVTDSTSSDQTPKLLPQACESDEQATETGLCLLADESSLSLRLMLDQPALVAAQLGDFQQHVIASRSQVALYFDGLEADRSHNVQLTLESASGDRHTQSLQASTTPPLATLAISEVLADPQGPEPAQEYVEIWNYGINPVALDNLWLTDDGSLPGQLITSSLSLSPGSHALLVADDYNPEQGLDPAPAPGVPLVRVGKSLAKSGLANRGEPLFLRDANGHRLSASPAMSTSAGSCLARAVSTPPRLGTVAEFTTATCTPGQ